MFSYNPTQYNDRLYRIQKYHFAVKNIRSKYLKSLENNAITQTERNEILNANFMLEFMLHINEPYQKLLMFFNENRQERVQLLISLDKNNFLEDFIREFENIRFNSSEFKLDNSHLNAMLSILDRPYREDHISIPILGLTVLLGVGAAFICLIFTLITFIIGLAILKCINNYQHSFYGTSLQISRLRKSLAQTDIFLSKPENEDLAPYFKTTLASRKSIYEFKHQFFKKNLNKSEKTLHQEIIEEYDRLIDFNR